MLDGEVTDEEERNMRFSFSTLREIARGMKRIWDSKMRTPSSAQIIEDVDLALKALEIFESHIRFIPRAISLGVEKLTRIFLSSSSVPSPSSTKQLKMQWKRNQ